MSSVAPASPDEREPTDAAMSIPYSEQQQPSSRWLAREQMQRAASAVFVGVGVVSGGQLALLGLSAVSLLCSEMGADDDEVRPCWIRPCPLPRAHHYYTRTPSAHATVAAGPLPDA